MKEIENLIESLKSKYNILKYVYNKEFVPGKTPVYYSGPFWGDEEVVAIIENVLFGEWISSGEKVHQFEKAFSDKFNFKNSLMVNSGSSANLVLIKSMKKCFGWSDKDEIIVSPVGFPTTYSPIIDSFLIPVFVDVELNSFNFDLTKIEEKISSRTKAVFLSPPLGNPCDVDALSDLCEQKGLLFILDNCDSLGSKWRGRYINEYSMTASCSFYPAHHLSTGEGGMMSTSNDELMHIARSISWWGRGCYCVGKENLYQDGVCKNRFGKWIPEMDHVIDHKYLFTNIGYNLRPLDLQGAVGLVQLNKFDEIHSRRVNSKKILHSILEKIKGVTVPTELPCAEVSWFGTPVLCENRELKEKLVRHLEDNKVQTRNLFAGNILLHPAYRYIDDYKKYPNSNEVFNRVFFIGASPHYGEKVFDYVREVIEVFRRNNQ